MTLWAGIVIGIIVYSLVSVIILGCLVFAFRYPVRPDALALHTRAKLVKKFVDLAQRRSGWIYYPLSSMGVGGIFNRDLCAEDVAHFLDDILAVVRPANIDALTTSICGALRDARILRVASRPTGPYPSPEPWLVDDVSAVVQRILQEQLR